MKQSTFDLRRFDGSDMGEVSELPVGTQQAEESGEETKEASAAGEQTDKEARAAGFRKMMEGEYKDLFTAYFQETFNKRFKEQKGMEEELKNARRIVDAAAARFGVRDTAALCEALRAETEKTASAESAAQPAAPEKAEATAPTDELQRAIDQAVAGAVERARLETERAVMASIRARGARPTEAALAPGTGAPIGHGASHLSRAQRAEMARRAAKGERIEF